MISADKNGLKVWVTATLRFFEMIESFTGVGVVSAMRDRLTSVSSGIACHTRLVEDRNPYFAPMPSLSSLRNTPKSTLPSSRLVREPLAPTMIAWSTPVIFSGQGCGRLFGLR